MTGKRVKTGVFLPCFCGSKGAVTETARGGYYSHCLACGAMTFFNSQQLLEKLRAGAKSVCPHNPQFKKCTGGLTSFCPICRVRVFRPQQPE